MSGRSVEGSIPGPKPREISPDRFYPQVGRFPEDAQIAISGLSSLLLEGDVKERIVQNPTELQGIYNELKGTGLSHVEVGVVFSFFRLPKPPIPELAPEVVNNLD